MPSWGASTVRSLIDNSEAGLLPFIDNSLLPAVWVGGLRRRVILAAAQDVVFSDDLPDWKVPETASAIDAAFEAGLSQGLSVVYAWEEAVRI